MTHLNTWARDAKLARYAIVVATACCAFCAIFGRARGQEDGESKHWERAPRSHFVEVVRETCLSVVSIQGEKQYESGKRSYGRDAQYDVFNGMGTGVVVDSRGYILTNYHVVKGLLKLEVTTADGERYRDVELIRNDPATDLAILKIKPKKPLKKIRMGRAERVQLAEDVYAIGNPFGYSCSISRGIVSALDRPLEVNETLSYDRVIQTDAPINPGNSGGPLINVDGEMIGLNAAVREEAENIAFAIPIDVVSEVTERMIRQSVAKMTHHGLKFRVVDSDMPDYPQCGNGEDCLVVESVDSRSLASEAGVLPGDVLLSSNGFSTHSSLDFTCSLIGMGLTDAATLKFNRDGETLDASLAFSGLSNRETTLASRKSGTSRAISTEDVRYDVAEVEDSFAQETTTVDASDGDDGATSSASLVSTNARAERRASAAQRVWDVFGVEVETAAAEEYRRRYPKQAVGIGDFNFVPNGGVVVTRVDPEGPLGRGEVAIEEDDFIFGFGVGAEKEGQLGVASLDNLYYIAKRAEEFAKVDSGKARVYLIRNGSPYFLEIDLNETR